VWWLTVGGVLGLQAIYFEVTGKVFFGLLGTGKV